MEFFGNTELRELRSIALSADLVVVGGGLAGVCAAITAAREDLKVVLVQDRPVLGGNASSEVRLWALGATSHMGNNNRWAREGGVIDEILVENTYRNPEGNPHLFDTLLLDKVLAEKNITLLLDTVVFELSKLSEKTIKGVSAFCSLSGTLYAITGSLFCDASGDGLIGYLSGASFRIGAETSDEFDEGFAPDNDYGECLGHTIFFYSKDTGKPVKFIPPDFALKNITEIPRYRNFKAGDTGCMLWWLEYGGCLDTVHDSQKIKHELQRIIFGVWHYIKNSGEFPEAENLTLEWVGSIPGKRESRRFVGDFILSQKDIIDQRHFDDAVSYGGWAIDLHPGDGVYSELSGCTQWHGKGVYQIPFRTMYSRDIENLFLAGRIISASHVAFGSTRVMATSAHNAQVVGLAAAVCKENNIGPESLLKPVYMKELQCRLLRSGQYIPHVELTDPDDLTLASSVEASSEYKLFTLPPDGDSLVLDCPRAMLLPFKKGPLPKVTFYVNALAACEMDVELRVSSRLGNFTPDVTLETLTVKVPVGRALPVALKFETELDQGQYVFLCLMRTRDGSVVEVLTSAQRVTGVLSLLHQCNHSVARGAVQQPPAGIGIESFEFWLPQRRPAGKNFALTLSEPVNLFSPVNVTYGYQRPYICPNAWVADPSDKEPVLSASWDKPVCVKSVILFFDTDFDHPMESVQMGHPDREMPFCIKDYDLIDESGKVVYMKRNNHQSRNVIDFDKVLQTRSLSVKVLSTHGAPAAIFRVMVF